MPDPLHTVYRTTNAATGEFYIGVHKTRYPDDEYLGSGNVLKVAIQKHGRSSFNKEVLFTYSTRDEAFSKEIELLQEARKSSLCYNVAKGGQGSNIHLSGSRPPCPIAAQKILKDFGKSVRIARLRRRLPLWLLADRASISRQTIMKVEQGNAGVSLGNVATILLCLGLENRLSNLLSSDEVGLALEEERLPKRVRLKRS